MANSNLRTTFIIGDIVASGLAWSLFFIYRKVYIETVKFGVVVPIHPDFKFVAGLIFISAFWFIIYHSSGTYSDIRRKRCSKTFFDLLMPTIVGALVIFFLLILDDTVISYQTYYRSFGVLFFVQVFFVLLFRSAMLYLKDRKFRKGLDSFKVLILGKADDIERFCNDNKAWMAANHLEVAGGQGGLSKEGRASFDKLFVDTKAEEVFVLHGDNHKNELEMTLLHLYQRDIYIRILPEVYTSTNIPLKINEMFHAPLLMLSKEVQPAWQRSVKTFLDISLSLFALLVLMPLILLLAVAIKVSSPGPVVYSHERIGKNGKPFRILKFRSMFVNSEPNGPQLATLNDNRITKVGRFMRKRRLDEIPNLLNVLRGEMSLVGPRPERQFFIDQILEKAPEYAKLHLAKPGITSWGQVHFGYAENVDKMISRMKYDLVYIENMSLLADMQILARTIGTILKGQGI